MKILANAVVLAVALVLSSPSGAAPRYSPKVSIERARATALEQVPGKLIEEELEFEKGRWVYEFEIKPTGERGRAIKEVAVDPETGKVLAIDDEVEDGAEDDDDGADDDDDDKNEQAKSAKKKPVKKGRHTARR